MVYKKPDVKLLNDFIALKNERPLFAPMWEPMLVPPFSMAERDKVGRFILPEEIKPEDLIENIEMIAKNLPYMKTDLPFAFGACGGNQWLEAICGTEIRLGTVGIWAKAPGNNSIEEFINAPISEAWYEKLLECHEAVVNWAKGEYFVSVPVLHGPLDIVEGFMGAEKLVYAIYDTPELFKEALQKASDLFLKVAKKLIDTLVPVADCYAGRMHLYTTKPCATLQDDTSYMTSPDLFMEFVAPEEKKIIAGLPSTVYHMHNTSLHLWEKIMDSGYASIQISVDPNGPPKGKQIEIFEEMKKQVPIVLAFWDFETMELFRKNLKPNGLALTFIPSPASCQINNKGQFDEFLEWNNKYMEFTSNYK